MKLDTKSLLYSIVIVGIFTFLCFRADKVPVIGTYLAGDLYGEQTTLNPDGEDKFLAPIAQSHYDSFMLTLWITALLCVTVGGPLVYALFAFKEKPGFDPKKDKLPIQSHGNTKVEVGLIFYSTILLVIIAFLPFGKMKIPAIAGIPYFFEGKTNIEGIPKLDEDAMEIDVYGHQWWFSFHYPEHGLVTSNELVFPINTPVKINLHTEDVIHSFWLSKIAGKVDLMPGQVNHMWLYADKEGNYSGQCAEYCGDSHAYMLFRGHATTQDKFDQWVKTQLELASTQDKEDGTYLSFGDDSHERKLTEQEALGEKLFNGKAIPEQLEDKGHTTNAIACNRCHALGAMPAPNYPYPNLNHFAERTTIAAGWRNMEAGELKTWIQQPGKVKPGNRMWRDFALNYGVIDADTTEDLFNRKQTHTNAHYSFFTDEEAEAIAAFLLTLKHPGAPDWGEPPLKSSKQPKAKEDETQASAPAPSDKLAQN